MHLWEILSWFGLIVFGLVAIDFVLFLISIVARAVRKRREAKARHRQRVEEEERRLSPEDLRAERAKRVTRAGKFMGEGFDRILERVEKEPES